MELILLQDIEKVGRKGDIVRVRDGFARNLLLPRKWAVPCTRSNQQFVEEQRERNARRREKERQEALTLGERLEKLILKIEAPAGEQDKLYGSVTSEDISDALKQQGFSIPRKQILFKAPLRRLGTHSVTVELYTETKATVTLEVVRKPS